MYLHVRKTATREAIECNRYFPAAVNMSFRQSYQHVFRQSNQSTCLFDSHIEGLIIIIIIIIAFKGAIRDFLQSPHSTANCLQHVAYVQVARAQSCANHVQHIEPLSLASVMLRATWYEGTAQLLSLTELKSHLFELYFVGWTIKTDEGGEETGVPGENLWRRASENATYYSPQIQALSETRTSAVALVAG